MIACSAYLERQFCLKVSDKKISYSSNGILETPQLFQISKYSNKNNRMIPPFSYLNSIYYFHLRPNSVDFFKFKYNNRSDLNDVTFYNLLRTPNEASTCNF